MSPASRSGARVPDLPRALSADTIRGSAPVRLDPAEPTDASARNDFALAVLQLNLRLFKSVQVTGKLPGDSGAAG